MANLCTDAGHGGPDSGAVWNNIREKDLNLAFVLLLNEELKNHGHHVLTTRKSDTHVPPLGTRCRLINAHYKQKAPQFDAIISLHCNVAAVPDESAAGGYRAVSSRKGLYVIYSAESVKSKQLAESISDRCRQAGIELNHQGMLSTVELGRTLAWIHKTLPPAVLIELGFMTNPEELALLQSADYRQRLIAAIVEGIEGAVS